MNTGTKVSPIAIIAVAVALTLAVLAYGHITLDGQDDEVEVDLTATWSPQRSITMYWQIGALISGETFTAEDRGTFNLTLNVPRGTKVVLLGQQWEPGELSCAIHTSDGRTRETHVADSEDCRVELDI